VLDDNPRLKTCIEEAVKAEQQVKAAKVKSMKASDFINHRPSTDLHEDPLVLDDTKFKGGKLPTGDLLKS